MDRAEVQPTELRVLFDPAGEALSASRRDIELMTPEQARRAMLVLSIKALLRPREPVTRAELELYEMIYLARPSTETTRLSGSRQ